MVGKWHMGSSDRPAPGFDYWWAHQLGGGPYHGAPIWRFGRGDRDPGAPREPAEEPAHLTDAITRQGLDFLRRIDDGDDTAPFFLQVNWTAPHDPWFDGQPSPGAARPLRGHRLPLRAAPPLHPWFREEELPARRGGPAQRARRLLRSGQRGSQHQRAPDDLEQRGLLENTMSSSPRTTDSPAGITGSGEGERDLPAELLGAVDHGSVHRALAGTDPAGAVDSRPASAVDLLDTLAELTGAVPHDRIRCAQGVRWPRACSTTQQGHRHRRGRRGGDRDP